MNPSLSFYLLWGHYVLLGGISVLGTLYPEGGHSGISQGPLYIRELWLSQQGYHFSSNA